MYEAQPFRWIEIPKYAFEVVAAFVSLGLWIAGMLRAASHLGWQPWTDQASAFEIHIAAELLFIWILLEASAALLGYVILRQFLRRSRALLYFNATLAVISTSAALLLALSD